MKKIGIITFHAALNYGAIIQCVALTHKLRNLGYDVCVIDYQPDPPTIIRHPMREAIQLYRELKSQGTVYRLLRAVRRAIRCILDIGTIPARYRLKKGFEDFRYQELLHTRRYTSLADLRKDPPDLDIYICGSDQLWNPATTKGIPDPAYFLNFGKKEIKKIAYAVSACNIDDTDEAAFTALLKELDVISLREEKNVNRIEQWSGKPVDINPDPSLLIDAQIYENMEVKVDTNGEYGLVFLLAKERAADLCCMLAEKAKDKYGVPVIDASPNKFCKIPNLTCVDNISPGEWLYLIHHAKYVITNSFHCMALSTIYRKDCFILPCPEDKMERLEEFSQKAGFHNRLIHNVDDINIALEEKIDFAKTQEFLEASRQKANAFFSMLQ